MSRFKSLVAIMLIACASTQAQTNTAQDNYQQARRLAFEEKNYAAARALCANAVQQDPAFTDARILMARLYAWEQQYDSARTILKQVLDNDPQHEDALMAITDVAY